MTAAALKNRVKGIVQDDSGKCAALDGNGQDAYDRAIVAALLRYSKHRPDTKVEDLTGDGSHDYALPAGWVSDFSMVRSIEYPMGTMPETLIDSDAYGLYQSPVGIKLRLKSATPEAAEQFRVAYTVLRTVETLPPADEGAVANLAAAYCLEELANAFAQSSDSTIAADSVNYTSKSKDFAARAKRLRALYQEHLGIREEDTTPAAAAVADLQINYPGGGDRLTHPRRARRLR